MNVAIIGGGISGLSLAHFLLTLSKQSSLKVSLFESSSILGGWANTTNVDDFGVCGKPIIFGPKSIRCANVKTPSILYLLSSLNIDDRLLVAQNTHMSSYKRYIFSKSQIRLANLKNILFGEMSPFDSYYEMLKTVPSLICPCKGVEQDISVHDFFSRNISERFSSGIINPIFHGIYATDCKELSLEFCLNDMYEIALKGGSLLDFMRFTPKFPEVGSLALQTQINNSRLNKRQISEKWKMFNGKGGVYEFICEIEKNLIKNYPNTFSSFKNKKVTGISFDQNDLKSVGIIKTSSENYNFDYIFSTIPAFEISNILPKNLNKLKKALEYFQYSSVAVVILEYDAHQCANFKHAGFGVVVPSQEDSMAPVIGIVFDDNLFKNSIDSNSRRTFTIMMGSVHFERYFGSYTNASSSDILQRCFEVMEKYLNISSNPVRSTVRILDKCILKPKPNHLSRAMECQSLTSGLPLCLGGTIFSGISFPDCVHHSLITAQKFLDSNSIINL